MALTIDQLTAAGYAASVNERKTAVNQWADNTVLGRFEKMGIIRRVDFGQTFGVTIDYRKNPGSGFQAHDLDPYSLVKPEVLTEATYAPQELLTPVTWSRKDDVVTPTALAKVDFAESLLKNSQVSHDDDIERAIFTADTNGFGGLPYLFPVDGLGSPGSIPASSETMWRNPAGTYLPDGSDFESSLTALWNQACKGSGSTMKPTDIVGGADPFTLFEGTQAAQRVYNSQDFNAGARALSFKTGQMHFSQYGGSSMWAVSKESVGIYVSKGNFRDRSATQELPDRTGFRYYIYSALQMATGAKSRVFVITPA